MTEKPKGPKQRRQTPSLTPLLWVGGKSRVLPQILPHLKLPAGEFQVVEAFAGSAALSFHFLSQPNPPKQVVLLDAVSPLLNFYTFLYHQHARICGYIRDLSLKYPILDRQKYEEIRARLNTLPPGAEQAAHFIVCNWSGYNGLWRQNSKGGCNVPWGQWTLEKDWPVLIQQVIQSAEALDRTKLTIGHWDATGPVTPVIGGTLDPACTLIYVDSPYPGTYSGYHHDWTEEDFRMLKVHLLRWKEHGFTVAVSFPLSHVHLLPAGWTVYPVSVLNNVGHTNESRNTRAEVLVLSP